MFAGTLRADIDFGALTGAFNMQKCPPLGIRVIDGEFSTIPALPTIGGGIWITAVVGIEAMGKHNLLPGDQLLAVPYLKLRIERAAIKLPAVGQTLSE